MDLSKYTLQNTIEVNNKTYEIYTDTQHFFAFLRILKSNKVKENEIDFMFKYSIPQDKTQALKKLVEFAYPKRELPKTNENEKSQEILLDYDKDSELLYSAFKEQYNVDLIKDKLHWHEFQALLFGLQNTKLNKIIEFRSYVIKQTDSKEYRTQMLELKRQWTIEEPITEEEQKAIDKFDKLLQGRN